MFLKNFLLGIILSKEFLSLVASELAELYLKENASYRDMLRFTIIKCTSQGNLEIDIVIY